MKTMTMHVIKTKPTPTKILAYFNVIAGVDVVVLSDDGAVMPEKKISGRRRQYSSRKRSGKSTSIRLR